jgi:hypothetical protein
MVAMLRTTRSNERNKKSSTAHEKSARLLTGRPL